jgi:hypothetical protein
MQHLETAAEEKNIINFKCCQNIKMAKMSKKEPFKMSLFIKMFKPLF